MRHGFLTAEREEYGLHSVNKQRLRRHRPGGQLQQVIAGIASADDLWALGGLPANLPEGDYTLGTALEARQRERLTLGWALGAYQFTRYKAPKRAMARLAMFCGFFLFSIFMICTGFALYGEGLGAGSWADRLFGWVIPLMGQSQDVHTWHRLGMWGMVVFVTLHVYAAIREDIMGRYANGRLLQTVAIVGAGGVSLLNVVLLAQTVGLLDGLLPG